MIATIVAEGRFACDKPGMEKLHTELVRLRGRLDRLNDATGHARDRTGDSAIGDCYGSLAVLESIAEAPADTGVHRRPTAPAAGMTCPGCGARLEADEPTDCALHARPDA